MPFAVRARFPWRLRTRTLALGPRTLIMGILNVTPDSFSDGGRFLDAASAVQHALELLDQGADILDLGGESTRPGAVPITPAQEQARALPVLRNLLKARPEAVVSIDTYHAETARLAVEAGAEIVNDVSGHLWDPNMSQTCAALACGAILMHTRGRPQQWRTLPPLAPAEVVPLVLRDLESRTQAALAAGIARASIAVDPGFGFGKRLDENYPLLARLDQLQALGFPILAGVSRKRFLASRVATNPGAPFKATVSSSPWVGSEPYALRSRADDFGAAEPALSLPKGLVSEASDSATTAANTAAILAGAHILRVHDVRPAREAAALADKILQSD